MGLKKTITAASLVHDGHPIATQAVPKDFSWLRDSTGSETQTLYFHLENGVVGFVQIAWAYLALTTTIETNSMVYVPGHDCVFETHNGHHLKVGKDSQQYECKGLAMGWNSDYTKLTVKYTAGRERSSKGMSAQFEFKRTADGYKIGDGKNHIGDGTAAHYFYPAGTVTADCEIHGKKFKASGVGLFIHAHSGNIMPYNVGAEWNMSFFTGQRSDKLDGPRDTDTFHVLQYTTPESVGAVNCSQAGLTRDGKLHAVFWENQIEFHERHKDPNGSGYKIPDRVKITSVGKTVDGKTVKATFDARPSKRLHDIDVLGEMPFVIKRLVQALITKPFIFERYEENAKITVEIEGEEPYEIVGSAFHELTLME
ncbi:putative cell survival pathways protein [Linderina macrospora]|uniref:Cell survival pathways protein n=1 Tax=Linderina macrospora TaxID=4868 RepID=A0ACC1J7G9_9FUNG|nr:putative cell survival pathways protein [Linderina macrospora]